MAKIFISYRRADSRKDAGRIYDRLVRAFGKDNIFKDVDDIPIGSDFRDVLAEAVSQCDVLLALIGQHWLTVKDADGNRRLDNEGDFVRIEVQTGLQRDKCLVVPVLVDNAPMPPATDLPDSLRELAFKNATIVRDDPDFHTDVTRLIDKLKQQFGDTVKPPPEKPKTTSPSPKPISPNIKAIDVETLIDRFEEAEEQENWTLAKSLLAQIRKRDDYPSWFMIDEFEQDVDEQIARLDIDKAYQRIVKRADRDSKKRILRMLEALWRDYQFYDPDNLVVKYFVPDVSHILPTPFEWCEIPAGEVTIDFGKDDSREIKTYQLDRFFMAKYPITNAQYQIFVDVSDGYQNAHWWDFSKDAKKWRNENSSPRAGKFMDDNLPRERVTWYEAMAFCYWLSQRTGTSIILPTEMQWQRAAQGDDGLTYPYGDTFDKNLANTREGDIKKTTSITQYPQGASPYGVVDMSGNVGEWTLSQWDNDSLDITDHKERVLRGGSWYVNRHNSRSTSRNWNDPNFRVNYNGFRVVCAVPE